MKIIALNRHLTEQTRQLMTLGAPYISARTPSDYWLYARLFSSTCPIAVADDQVIGAVIAFRSQDDQDEVYVQDVMTHPEHRGKSIARDLLQAVRDRAAAWGCRRIYLTSEPDNKAGHAAWTSTGYVNVPGDYAVDDVQVTAGFKGPGKDRAIYELTLS